MVELYAGMLPGSGQGVGISPGSGKSFSMRESGNGMLQAGRPAAALPMSRLNLLRGSPEGMNSATESTSVPPALSPKRSTLAAAARSYASPNGKVLEQGRRSCCPKGHALNQHEIAGWGAWCDGCMQALDVGSSVMDCRECNWLLCTQRCAKPASPPASQKDPVIAQIFPGLAKPSSPPASQMAVGNRPHGEVQQPAPRTSFAEAGLLSKQPTPAGQPSKQLDINAGRPQGVFEPSARPTRSKPEENSTKISDLEFLKQLVADHAQGLRSAEARIEELESENRALQTSQEAAASAQALRSAEARIEELELETRSLRTDKTAEAEPEAGRGEALPAQAQQPPPDPLENDALLLEDAALCSSSDLLRKFQELLVENAALRSRLSGEAPASAARGLRGAEAPASATDLSPISPFPALSREVGEAPASATGLSPVPPSPAIIPFLNLSALAAASAARAFCALSPATTSTATVSSGCRSEAPEYISNWDFESLTTDGVAVTLQPEVHVHFLSNGNSGLTHLEIMGWQQMGSIGNAAGLYHPPNNEVAEGGAHVLFLNTGDDNNYVYQTLLEPFLSTINIEAAVGGGNEVLNGGYRMGLYAEGGTLVQEVAAGVDGAPVTENSHFILTHLSVSVTEHQDVVGQHLQLRLMKNMGGKAHYHYIRVSQEEASLCLDHEETAAPAPAVTTADEDMYGAA